ncbi:MAG: hypothetical protein NVSMB49_22750 [Ktedonobacteraceae bacterium]
MGLSLLSEQDALSQKRATVSNVNLPRSIVQFTTPNQSPDTTNSILPDDTLCDTPTSSVVSILECGLNCIRQERYSEGITFLARARERLTARQIKLADRIDAFIQDCETYNQAQQALHQASKRFAEFAEQQRTQIAIFERLLPTFMQDRDTDGTLHTLSQPLKNSNNQRMVQTSFPSVEAVYPQKGPQQTVIYVDENSDVPPALSITCFSRFEVKRLGQPVILCSNRNGQAILRYLVAQPEHRAMMDMLMAILWPEDETTVAHHKLQVAVSALRRSLNHGYIDEAGGGYILCKNQVYELNPLIPLRSDLDEFMEYYRVGRYSSGSMMAACYERACDLYTGPFLSEDLYADWSFMQRKQLNQLYCVMCSMLARYYLEVYRYEDAMRWSGAILKENRCDEEAHRQLMRIYAAQGRRSEALRQYQLCERILVEELGVQPMPETRSLFWAIFNNENLPEDGIRIERK